MNRMLRFGVSLAFVMSMLCSVAWSQPVVDEDDLRFKIGQILVIGFRGTKVDERSAIMLSRHNIGGVILFDRDVSDSKILRNVDNPAQLKKLISQVQRSTYGKVFVSVDQEGGKVARLKSRRGFFTPPSPQDIAKKGADSAAYFAAKNAEQLRDLGFNVNFAPCVDVNVNPKNPIIGAIGRSISSNADTVIKYGTILVEEHRKKGILTALKHFPGHGSSMADSHLGLTDVTNTFDAERELKPFREMISKGLADIVMVGHLFNSHFDSLYPATLSEKTINGLLRKELGFTGVVATDDMHMKAITDNYSYPKALELALNAGVDMIVVGNNGSYYDDGLCESTIVLIYNLVKSGKVSQARIDEAYERVKLLREKI